MHVFLSPHYDDAVYSCGGTIHQLTQRGEPVLIVTVMGGAPPDPPPNTPIVRDLHQRWAAGDDPIAERQREDKQAAALLGAQVMHWDIPDCVYRVSTTGEALHPTEGTLWHTIHPHDPATTRLQQTAIPHAQTAQVYAPMGVGGHVDHLVVRAWAQTQSDDVIFYPEYPYTEQAGAVETAQHALAMHFALQPHTVLLTETDIAAKIKGVKAYRSQISTFWQDERSLAARVRAALNNPPAETFFRAERKP